MLQTEKHFVSSDRMFWQYKEGARPRLDSPLWITTNKLKYPDDGVILSKSAHYVQPG